MKKTVLLVLVLLLVAFYFSWARGQGMMTNQAGVSSDDHTAKEEAEGKEVWSKLQSKETNCNNLSEEDFEALGEYFMGLMMGESHAAMNSMMIQMMGESGEEEMHVVMGKRLSGCDTSATFPTNGNGFMPMMQMFGSGSGRGSGMMGDWGGRNFNSLTGWGQENMMSFGYSPFGWMGFLSMFLWWGVIVLAVVLLFRWLRDRGNTGGTKSALDIAKDRYARGEIDKKDFEEIKKELNS